MEQLGEELTELKNDSIEYRQQAAQRQERLREAADAASDARLESLRQRDEANREYDEVSRDREQLRRERDQLLSSHEQAIANRNEAIAERDSARGERDRLAFVSEEFCQHLNRAGSAQAEMTDRIRKLNTELNLAAEQLRAARTELAASYARVETLSIEAAQARKQLQNRDQAQAHQTQTHEALIQSLRSEISKLEADRAAARTQAASAATDRQLVESLQSSLASTETSRTADRLSWEQEAAALQDNIQQLSLELASVTGRMTQSELDHEATKSERNEAHGRLTTARRELTMRPSLEQWDELQSQLADTEQELDRTEKQLGLIRRDYDELLGRQAIVTDAVSATPASTILEEPAASPINAIPSIPAFASLSEIASPAEPVPAAEPVLAGERLLAAEPLLAANSGQDSIDDVDNVTSNDHGWPTYCSHSDYTPPASTASEAGEDDDSAHSPSSEPWPSSEAEIADRLQSYTTHDESHRLALSNEKTPLAVAPSELNLSLFPAVELSHSISQPTLDADLTKDSSELGSLAKRLIAQLSEANAADAADDNSAANGQSLTASSIWERVPDHATTGELASDNDTPSVWNFSSQFRAADEFREVDSEEDNVNDDEDIDEEVEADYLLREQSLLRDRQRGLAASEEPTSQQANDQEPVDQTFMLPMDSHFHAELETPAAAAEVSRFEPQIPMVVRQEPIAVVSNDEPVDDDSIEAYMNRLLKRVQGQSGAASETASPKPVAVAVAQQSTVKTSSSVEQPAETSAPLKPIEVVHPNTPLVRRSQAPEHAANLATMREIANTTADTAISQSVRGQAQQLKSRAVMDLFQAGVVLACAVAFYACGLKISSLRYVWFTAAALAASLAFFFLLDMMKKLSSAKASYDRANSQASNDFNEE